MDNEREEALFDALRRIERLVEENEKLYRALETFRRSRINHPGQCIDCGKPSNGEYYLYAAWYPLCLKCSSGYSTEAHRPHRPDNSRTKENRDDKS